MKFIQITEAKVHDKKFPKELDLISSNMIIFDKDNFHCSRNKTKGGLFQGFMWCETSVNSI
ncbi:hypothetical protein EZS27_028062 [termite gut metagenome]|uniref:Uncharacterized protein n=1 Tax=termite gut metagenome TaxID=433724 RepID=A0A5J4QKG2_9ZZZZ